MKRKKTVHFELDPEEVKQAVILLVGHQHPDLKDHLKSNHTTLDFDASRDAFTLLVDGVLDDE